MSRYILNTREGAVAKVEKRHDSLHLRSTATYYTSNHRPLHRADIVSTLSLLDRDPMLEDGPIIVRN